MSLLPPPPAPQQQRRAVGAAVGAAPPSRGRGLYSDAVGLRPDVRIEPSRHPTTSVGLHDGPKFAPQHRAVAAPAALDIDAMVAARLSATGAGDKPNAMRRPDLYKSMPADPAPAAANRASMFRNKAAARGADAARAARGAARGAANGIASGIMGAYNRASEGLKEMNAEDKLTGMDAYDYGMFSNVESYELLTKKKKTTTVYFKKEGAPMARSVIVPPDNALPNGKHGIALLATVDKSWKTDRFHVDKGDKVKVFGTGKTEDYPYAVNSVHRELQNGAGTFYEDARNKWFEKITAGGEESIQRMGGKNGKLTGGTLTRVRDSADTPGEAFVLSVAKLQHDAQTHTVYNYTNQGTQEQTASGPHDLCMGSAATVPVANAPAHIKALVGDYFLTLVGNEVGVDPSDQSARAALNEQDELDKPYVIPVASQYDQTRVEFQDLKSLGFVGGSLHALSGLLVVPTPNPGDESGKAAWSTLLGGNANEGEKTHLCHWSRFFPGQFAPLMPVGSQEYDGVEKVPGEDGRLQYDLKDEYGQHLYGTKIPGKNANQMYGSSHSLASYGAIVTALTYAAADALVSFSAEEVKTRQEADPVALDHPEGYLKREQDPKAKYTIEMEVQRTVVLPNLIATKSQALHEMWGDTKPLDAPPSKTDLTFNWTQGYAQSKFACAVLGLYHGANGLEISKHALMMPRQFSQGLAKDVAPEPISVRSMPKIWLHDGEHLHNALPNAMRGDGLDLRFLWCAMKLTQRCMNASLGSVRVSGVSSALSSLKGNKSISTETKSKYRMLLSSRNYMDASQSLDGERAKSFVLSTFGRKKTKAYGESADDCCGAEPFADYDELPDELREALVDAMAEDQL